VSCVPFVVRKYLAFGDLRRRSAVGRGRVICDDQRELLKDYITVTELQKQPEQVVLGILLGLLQNAIFRGCF